MTHDLETTRRLLTELGYQVLLRENGWWECLLVSDDTWRGAGPDPLGALQDALRSALPSSLARRLLVERMEVAAARKPVTVAPPPEPAPPEAVVQGAAEPVAAPEQPAPAAPESPPETSAKAPEAAKEPAPEESPKPPTVREVLAEIRSMRKQIEVDAEELALAAPRRQRLVMLGWITRARAAQTAFPDDAKIDAAVAALARTLTNYCQMWWPGSVRSLKISTRPEDVVHDLTIPVDRPPSNWVEASEVAERNVRTVEDEDESRGRDASGWADASRLHPPPRDADAMLEEIIAEVEKLSGPVGAPAASPGLPEPAAFLEWARKLRWARETTGAPARWGALMGRFRYWVREHPSRFPEVARTLDPEWGPDRSWAALLGLDPETIQRNRELRELFTQPPQEGADEESVRRWLARALTYSDTHLPAIVNAMMPFRARLAGLDGAELPGSDRRMRRRFLKLQKELASPTPSQMPPPVDEAPPAPELPTDPVSDSAAIPATLRDPIVPFTRGKRALFVSNRADPNLRQRLKELFEFEELDWSAGETKRRQALVTPIQSGSYQFVLGATGFLSHSIDGQISQACRKGKVPYVRVHRGRPLACLRAMARELGLQESSNHPATLEEQ